MSTAASCGQGATIINFELPSALRALGPPDVVVLATAVLVAGALVGEVIARTTRLPRLVGYTLAGWIAVAFGHGVTVPLEGAVRLIVDLALALLLFEIGSRVRLRWLRHNPGLLITSLAEAVLAAVAVLAALLALDVPRTTALACALLAMPTSAAVAGRVAQELGAEGQVTQRMNVLTALNTMYAALAIIAFQATLQAGRAAQWPATLEVVALSTAISLLLAVVLALAVSLLLRRMDLRNDSTVIPVLGFILLAVGLARWLGASSLLVPLLAGLALRNISDRAWVWPRHFGTAGGVLVLMLFVIVGASWSPALLAAGGLAGLALLAARSAGKGLAVIAFSRWSHISLRQGIALAVTLTPLSATSLVMLSDLVLVLPELAASVAPIILTAVAVLELAGPIAVQLALRYAGEYAGNRATDSEPR